jgi:methylenetetrahydrofolate dehydrogenase (NADP+)/methenyltetrahydrofolate cyclohydrolase
MSATLMLGNEIATKTYEYVRNKVKSLKTKGVAPYLVAILVGDDPGSVAYLKIKARMCMDCGIKFKLLEFPSYITERELIDRINILNESPEVTGIIIQLPLPSSIERDKLLLTVDESKDIDAFTYSLKDNSKISVRPPAPAGMIEIINHYHIDMIGKQVVIVGDGLLVGQPLGKMLLELGIHANVIRDQSKASLQFLKEADIIFCGVGKANIITPEMLRANVVVIDAGYNKIDGVTYGDCDVRCAQIASFITPSIGGIGPLTVSNLLKNVVDIIEK